MADEIIFYTNPMSRGQIVRWMLEEVGQPYSTEVLGFEQVKSPAYLAINPMGKVPAIRHGGQVITECAAICAYLADAFPEAGLAPPMGAARAPYYRWLFFAAGPVEAAVSNRAAGFQASEQQSRMLGYGAYETVMDTLESLLDAGAYIAGDRFSAADLYLGAQIIFGLRFGTIEKRPAFEAYAQKLLARPACLRAKAIDEALIAQMQKS